MTPQEAAALDGLAERLRRLAVLCDGRLVTLAVAVLMLQEIASQFAPVAMTSLGRRAVWQPPPPEIEDDDDDE